MREYVLGPEVAGGWAVETVADTTRHPPVVYKLHYEFQGWLGDDVVETFPAILVTRRLADAFEEERLTGADFDEAKVTTDPQFERLHPDAANSLPEWRWLRPTGRPHGSDFWLLPNASLVVSERALAVMRRFVIDPCDVSELKV